MRVIQAAHHCPANKHQTKMEVKRYKNRFITREQSRQYLQWLIDQILARIKVGSQIQVDVDFQVALGNGNGLMKKWEPDFGKNIPFLKSNGHIMDKSGKCLLEKMKEDKITEIPTNKAVKKDSSGKTDIIKYTIKDSQESFLYSTNNQQQIEEHLRFLKSKQNAIQPFILCDGAQVRVYKHSKSGFSAFRKPAPMRSYKLPKQCMHLNEQQSSSRLRPVSAGYRYREFLLAGCGSRLMQVLDIIGSIYLLSINNIIIRKKYGY
ncbi:hypothetical protein JTB14_004588 [Gonioctena quinquepunctata]|nr:hypothetical protein JTB14_004588 [Gonioctena quinquepunctata]